MGKSKSKYNTERIVFIKHMKYSFAIKTEKKQICREAAINHSYRF